MGDVDVFPEDIEWAAAMLQAPEASVLFTSITQEQVAALSLGLPADGAVVESLVFRHAHLGHLNPPGVRVLARGMVGNRSLQRLTICDDRIGNAECKDLGRVLATSRTLKHLTLHNTGIESVGAARLWRGLNSNGTLEELDLSGNPFGDRGLEPLGDLPHALHGLTKLDVSTCGVSARGVRSLSSHLDRESTLRTLVLNSNDLGDEGANEIGLLLEDNDVLQRLHMDSCMITDAGAGTLALALDAGNGALEELSLRYNRFGHTGGRGLVDAMREHRTLGSLVLEGNRVGVEVAKALVNALESRGVVTPTLSLQGLGINVEDMAKLMPSLVASTAIHALHLGIDQSTDADWSILRPLLVGTTALGGLHLRGAGIDDKQMAHLCHGLHANSTITWIDLGGNVFTDTGVVALATVISTSKTLAYTSLSSSYEFSERSGGVLLMALRNSVSMEHLDVEHTRISDEVMPLIEEALRQSRAKARKRVAAAVLHEIVERFALGNVETRLLDTMCEYAAANDDDDDDDDA